MPGPRIVFSLPMRETLHIANWEALAKGALERVTAPKLVMPIKLGIGVTTFNRCRKLETCISQLQRLTSQPSSLVIGDDGSKDGTVAMCAQQQIVCVGPRCMATPFIVTLGGQRKSSGNFTGR